MLLSLAVEATPPPVFQWYKNGYIIHSNDYITVNNQLIVLNSNQTHSGTYSCLIKNMAGEYMWLEATVIVKD